MTADGGLLVAVETSGPIGSVAVGRRGDVRGRVFLAGASTHAGRLIPALERLLEDAEVDRRDVEGVVVGAGPGSFTGVRVAAATAKGLVHALGLPLWAVSSLEAAAVGDRVLRGVEGPWDAGGSAGGDAARDGDGGPGGDVRGGDDVDGGPVPTGPDEAPVRTVLFDARSDRVYAASYRIGPSSIEVLRPPRATRIDAVLKEDRPPGLRFVGTGAVRHRAAIVAAGGSVLPPPAGTPSADGLLHVLRLRPERRPLKDPWAWEPDYLRASGAERSRRR